MACFNRLKSDIHFLLNTFAKAHPLFRIQFANVDEICCAFIVNRNSKEIIYNINANITESYPSDPPVWFCDSDDISSIIEILTNTTGMDNYVSNHLFPICLFSHLSLSL